ncbi:MAG TPA: stage V sporulation protein AC, partial [Clostridia bacterium]|nr:stage V sporulation protein AC [Clostridia bacterium]
MSRATKSQEKQYKEILAQVAPPRPILRNCVAAFLVGGAICALGQVVLSYFLMKGMPKADASSATSIVMVFLGAFLTGLGVYDKLGPIAGMGAALPITGFANSIVAPAMEFKREGYVLGIAARMFTVAGPVLVFGTLTSFVAGIIS